MASDRFTPSKYIAKKQPETQQVVVDISESISQIPNQDALITHTDRAKSLRMRATMNDDEKGSLSSAIKPFPQRSYPVMKKVKRELVSVLSERKGWTIFWLIVINVLCSTGLFVYSGTTNSLAFKALAEFLGRMKHTTVPLKALTSFSYLTIFDLLSLLTCLLSLWVSLQKPSTTFSFGYERFEVLAVFSSTVLVMFGGLFIVKESTERLLMPSEVITDNLLPAAAVGLFLHLLVTYGVSNKPFSLVSQTASSNWLQDAVNDFGHSICGFAPFLSQALVQKLNPISLVGIAGAGLVLITDAMITYNNSYVADSLCAIVAAFMMWATMLPLSVCSGQILLQASTLDGVLEFRNEHFWTISFGRLAGSLHVRVRRDASEQMVLAHVTNKLSNHVTHLTVQVFKDDWIRSSSGSKLNIPNLSASPQQGAPLTKNHSSPQLLKVVPLASTVGKPLAVAFSHPRKTS
ncbi:zinc transporter 6-like isoform X2 [Acropora millepora]|uniref:zinc transporter 6-like isoform X2 n=1 Tax=Acropora millepora TaxID=45264 RepID=UPI001CF54709|nr:zinc transporter 6-like isoform X2 [Acropora millepora]